MRLMPEEEERLQIFVAAQLARRRQGRGLKLSYPEAVALICDEVLEAARDGRSYDDVSDLGHHVLTGDDVMEGVPELLDSIHIEALFEEGTLMVSLYSPLGSGEGVIGAGAAAPEVVINTGRDSLELLVTNTLDRAVQVPLIPLAGHRVVYGHAGRVSGRPWTACAWRPASGPRYRRCPTIS